MPEFEAQTLGIGAKVNPNVQQYVSQMIDGQQFRALALKRISKLASLRATGIAKPASIVNFNPVCLRMEGGFDRKIPAATDDAVRDDLKLEFRYKDRRYKATIVTLRDPILYTKITDVYKTPEQELGDGRGVYDIEVCKQIEVAHAYWTTYNHGAHDSSGMGGVLMFQGDQHALKGDFIEVPKFVSLPNGAREYYTESESLAANLAQCLDTQKTYYDNQMQIAQIYHDDPDQKKNVTMVHRIWAQWGVDMGFSEKGPVWLLNVDELRDSCDGCGSVKKKALAYFCHACARPYDPLRAYLDKELAVDSVHMHRLKDEDWPIVHAEEKRRKALRMPPPDDSETEDKPKGKK